MTHDICIPFWGDPGQLYLAVDSVRAQSVPDWRLVVIDDVYPDASVAEYFAAIDDPRISYIRNEENVGITENFRRCAQAATGDYVTILGCDDLLHPNFVDVVTRTIASVPTADIVQPGVDVIDENGTRVEPLVDRVKQRWLAPRGSGIAILAGESLATSLIRGDWLYWPSLTFRVDVLRHHDFRDELTIIQDLALLMDIAFDGGTLAYNPEVAFSYRRHSASASQRTLLDGRRFQDERRCYELAREIATAKGWSRTRRAASLRTFARLHAVTELPGVLLRGTRSGVRSTLVHIFGR